MAIFLVGAVFVAPFVSSFADAAFVAALQGESYWLVWRTRFFSNVLTELTLVPAIVTVSTMGPVWFRRAGLRRHLEAGALGVGLLVTGFMVFAGPISRPGPIPGWPGTPLVLVLPFILVAAVRFGPGGASLSLLATGLVAIWAATHGRGPFTTPLLARERGGPADFSRARPRSRSCAWRPSSRNGNRPRRLWPSASGSRSSCPACRPRSCTCPARSWTRRSGSGCERLASSSDSIGS